MLPFKEDGYNFWTWRGHKIHYVVQGSGPPVVLVHGFGASAFHWRSISLPFYHFLWQYPYKQFAIEQVYLG